jgi:DNA-directed RNA polymerase subunit N (RpoN/RPB10)
MSLIQTHSIRCKSCGRPVSCFIDEYKELTEEMSIENALNKMEVFNLCCRMEFQFPTNQFYDVSDDNKINGFESVKSNFDIKLKVNLKTNIQHVSVEYPIPKWTPKKKPSNHGECTTEKNPLYELELDNNGLPILHQTYLCV